MGDRREVFFMCDLHVWSALVLNDSNCLFTTLPDIVGIHLNITGSSIPEVNGIWWQHGVRNSHPMYEKQMVDNNLYLEYESSWSFWQRSQFWTMWRYPDILFNTIEKMFYSNIDDPRIAQTGWSAASGFEGTPPTSITPFYDDGSGGIVIDPDHGTPVFM